MLYGSRLLFEGGCEVGEAHLAVRGLWVAPVA
jgi:hypothetical protein